MHFDTRHFVYLNTLATLVYAVSRNYKILFLMSNTRDCYQQCTQYEVIFVTIIIFKFLIFFNANLSNMITTKPKAAIYVANYF